jgi:hypothetical protein
MPAWLTARRSGGALKQKDESRWGVGGCACVSVVETQAHGLSAPGPAPRSLGERMDDWQRFIKQIGKQALIAAISRRRSQPLGFSSVFISQGYRTPIMTLTPQSLLAELDLTLTEVSQDWRATVLGQIADLFLNSADRYSKDQVALFDTVMSLLIPGVDRLTLAPLSDRLADVANPPAKVLASLASHPDPDVCGPPLERAKALPDKILVDAVERERIDPQIVTKIAARAELAETVTDSLLKRGIAAIQRTLLENPNARISEGGFARIIMGLDGDVGLAQLVASRADLPAELRPWLNGILKS